MRLRGVLDLSLGNFLCLRGFAKFSELNTISEAKEYQRGLIESHKQELMSYIGSGKYLFFPEVILSTTLARNLPDMSMVDQLVTSLANGKSFRFNFEQIGISGSATRSKAQDESRGFDYFQRATLFADEQLIKSDKFVKFGRIDGNHRLSAFSAQTHWKDHNTPFCLILFRNPEEEKQFSSTLFHNINSKARALKTEETLKVILDDDHTFPDEELKTLATFGWQYYLARKIVRTLDFEVLPHIERPLNGVVRTFFVTELKTRLADNTVQPEETEIARIKSVLSKLNSLYSTNPELSQSQNVGLLGALFFFQLTVPKLVQSFANWIVKNHIYAIEYSHSKDLIQVFNSVLESRRKTIFVSMHYGKAETENHYSIIERIASELNREYDLLNRIQVQRVDYFNDGTSYDIKNKIMELISDCGILIADLSYCNPNVYYELGFLMGKAHALNEGFGNFILFLDEAIKDQIHPAFIVNGIKQIRFQQTEQFAANLKQHLIKFYNLG